MNIKDRQESLTLEILEAIDETSNVTQRKLAKRMNVALGLANSYLKRCVRKGWVKIHQAPANRYLYYLTPTGFSEKGRLTAQYLSISFSFYRKAGDSCGEALRRCHSHGWNRLVLAGVSDLAEIASLKVLEHDLEIAGIYDRSCTTDNFLGQPVARRLEDCGPFDVCLLTDLAEPHATLELLRGQLEPGRIIVPGILGLGAIS